MIRNYIKVALRSLTRSRLTSFINISGLALAIACSLLIYLFIQDEIGYDRYHSKADRVYRVTRSFHSPEGAMNLHLANVAPPIGPLLKNDFAEIEQVARTVNFDLVLSLEENGAVKISNNEERLFLVEPVLFDIMDIEVLSGDPAQALSRPFTMMLSERAALKYFNTTDNVIGKRLRANNQFDLEVTGLYKDYPAQSHWHPEFMVSFATLNNDEIYGRTRLETNWGNNAFGTYVLLEEGVRPENISEKFPAFLNKHFGGFARSMGAPADFEASKATKLYLQPLTDIHLRSHLDDELEANGNINNVYMMGAIGVFIILIACFNFINLSTARATQRSKEVGLRKVVGAVRKQLVIQYLSESVLITCISVLLAFVFATAGLEWLNSFTGKFIPFNLLVQPQFVAALVLFAFLIGALAGIYPAFVISGFRPVLSLKGLQGGTRGKSELRRILVIAQFSISIVLIIATLITFQQLDYLNKRDLGYSKDRVVTLEYPSELSRTYDAFYNELTKSTLIENVTRSSRTPTGRLLDSYGDARITEGDSVMTLNVSLKTIAVDPEFFDTYSVAMIAGRNFSKDIVTDDSLSFIINEAATKEIGWDNAEQQAGRDFEYNGVKGKLIGIVKDFHFESLHQPIVPMIFVGSPFYNTVSVKTRGNDTREAIAYIEKVWKEFLPGQPFDFDFLSQRYAALYEAEQKQATLFTSFAILAIFIASLGLFGLTTFNTSQRTKEIGIRKVLGASVPHLLTLLSKEIVILLLLSNIIAWPLAYYMMSNWLGSFAYHISMNVVVYLVSAAAAIVVGLVTVSLQTVKAATANPANTLKYE